MPTPDGKPPARTQQQKTTSIPPAPVLP